MTTPEMTAMEIAVGSIALKEYIVANVSSWKLAALGDLDEMVNKGVTVVVAAIDKARDASEQGG